MKRALGFGLAATVLLGLPATPANAQGSVAIVGSELIVSPDPAGSSSVLIHREGTTYLVQVLPRATPGAGCSGDASTFVVTCPDPTGAVTLVVVQTGDFDSAVSNESTTPMFARTGAGDDTLAQVGAASATLISGPGEDFVTGGPKADVLRGGPGPDRLSPNDGRDRILAGGGSDRIRARDGRRDRVNGGPGRDEARVDEADHLHSVERTLGAGAA